LEEEHYVIDQAYDGKEGIRKIEVRDYDLAIIDLDLPEVPGEELVRKMRDLNLATPVIILTANDELGSKVNMLDVGADDYLTKPFALSELMARVQALIRRSQKQSFDSVLKKSDVELNLITREVFRQGHRIELQSKEFTLLEYLMKNSDCVLTKTQILEKVWNYQFDPQTNVVDVLVCRLRNKVDKDFEPKHIQTVRGFGYAFKTS
jgi:two-component system OmpR family response regulator